MPDDNKAPVERRITAEDWRRVADAVWTDLQERKKRRFDLEGQWDEIDRQVKMKHKGYVTADGKPIAGTAWMPALEQSLQAQALEVLTADARRLLFPDQREFFSAHTNLTDEYLKRAEFKSLLSDDQAEVPSLINQENADALVEGTLTFHHGLYDLRGVIDRLNAEAFKYGTLCGRIKTVDLSQSTKEFRGVGERRMPVLIPCSIRNTYLDDHVTQAAHEGIQIAPSYLREYWQDINDLRLAAAKGSKDPTKENGGWMPKRLIGMEPTHEDGRSVNVVEFEGDLIVPRSQKSIYLPNVIVTLAQGSADPQVIRYREREFPFRSYIDHPYHVEDAHSPYGVSPLMKGRPLQAACTEAFNRMMMAAILNAEPPIKWNPLDSRLQASGGPVWEPGAQWPSLTDVEVQQTGDPVALMQVFLALVQQYRDVVGISVPRLGGQTKSHQTAFAVGREDDRGQVRTVDYVRSLMFGPLPTFLAMEYHILRRTMPETDVFLPKYGGWVRLKKEHLPDMATFDVHGAGAPLEEREKETRRAQALQLALSIEITRRQLGEKGIDLQVVQEAMLREGFEDVDVFFATESDAVPQAPEGGPGVPGAPAGIPENASDAVLALSQG